MYTQELLENDHDCRIEFSEVMMNKINDYSGFNNKILFNDKTTCLNGQVNRHMCRF